MDLSSDVIMSLKLMSSASGHQLNPHDLSSRRKGHVLSSQASRDSDNEKIRVWRKLTINIDRLS